MLKAAIIVKIFNKSTFFAKNAEGNMPELSIGEG